MRYISGTFAFRLWWVQDSIVSISEVHKGKIFTQEKEHFRVLWVQPVALVGDQVARDTEEAFWRVEFPLIK